MAAYKWILNMYNIVFFVIIAFLVIDFAMEQVLSALTARDFGKPLPEALQGIYDDEKYAKQQEYSRCRHRFFVYESIFSMALMLIAFGFGLFGWLDGELRFITEDPVALALMFFGIIFLVQSVLDLPFGYYSTFVIEEKFGFNKSTHRTFWLDQLKSLLMTALIGGILLSALVLIYEQIPVLFWLLAWGVVALFTVFMVMFYSSLIVPLFNKQTPLEEGELRDAIEKFATKTGFVLDNIYVMDGSKRSTHANAYFSGFGPKKRVVLYDTLISQMTTDEIVAVLAHEIGHYKKGHVFKSMIYSLCFYLLMFYLMGLFLKSPELTAALNGTVPCFHLGMIAFSLLFTPISTVVGIIGNVLSRKHEYEADGFAAANGEAEELISGLRKLSANNLSNLQPHKADVFVHYSHPTLLQRITALRKS